MFLGTQEGPKPAGSGQKLPGRGDYTESKSKEDSNLANLQQKVASNLSRLLLSGDVDTGFPCITHVTVTSLRGGYDYHPPFTQEPPSNSTSSP